MIILNFVCKKNDIHDKWKRRRMQVKELLKGMKYAFVNGSIA